MVTVLVAILLVFAFALGTAVAALELAAVLAGRAARPRPGARTPARRRRAVARRRAALLHAVS